MFTEARDPNQRAGAIIVPGFASRGAPRPSLRPRFDLSLQTIFTSVSAVFRGVEEEKDMGSKRLRGLNPGIEPFQI
jgi:hypothetical protein